MSSNKKTEANDKITKNIEEQTAYNHVGVYTELFTM